MNMKHVHLFTYAVMGLIATSATNLSAQKADFREQKIGHIYHVSIPDYMTRSYSLNDAASLQYLNAARETYVIVIEDSKDHLLEAGIQFKNPQEFYDHFEKTFTDKSSKINGKQQLKINGNPAFQAEITKPFNEYNVHYLITVIESDTHFYKMLAWTIEDYKDQYLADFKRIANSLREDPGSNL